MDAQSFGQWTGQFVVVLTSSIFCLIALLLAVIGWFQARGARAAKKWNSTQGQVMESSVEQYSYRDGEGGSSIAYRPHIIYSYRVNGREYVGERLNFGSGFHTSIRSMATNKANQFPNGANVAVYYNPQDPNDAALEKTSPASRVLYIVAGIMAAVALATCAGGLLLVSIF